MVTCRQQGFILAMKFAWILYHPGAAESYISCAVNVTQPLSLEAYTASCNVTIQCAFSTEGCPHSSPTVLWFRYLAQAHEDLCTPDCARSEKFKATSSLPEKRASLWIIDIKAEDSAIYYCGVAFGESSGPLSKQTGKGTALTIRESEKYNRGVYVMMAVVLLLILYIAAVFAGFKVFSKPRTKKTGRGGHHTGIKGSGRAISRAIAQELRKKKQKLNRRPRQNLEKETIYQNK